jgi:hypothetical protein
VGSEPPRHRLGVSRLVEALDLNEKAVRVVTWNMQAPFGSTLPITRPCHAFTVDFFSIGASSSDGSLPKTWAN